MHSVCISILVILFCFVCFREILVEESNVQRVDSPVTVSKGNHLDHCDEWFIGIEWVVQLDYWHDLTLFVHSNISFLTKAAFKQYELTSSTRESISKKTNNSLLHMGLKCVTSLLKSSDILSPQMSQNSTWPWARGLSGFEHLGSYGF